MQVHDLCTGATTIHGIGVTFTASRHIQEQPSDPREYHEGSADAT
jgi:hypothetical protein